MSSLTDRFALRLGALFAFFAVILGALAAHGPVHDYLEKQPHPDLWRTALSQQGFHALALMALSSGPTRRGPVVCWLAGTVLFSGSLYILGLDSHQVWAGPLTPLGGLFLIAGWGWLWLSLLKKHSI